MAKKLFCLAPDVIPILPNLAACFVAQLGLGAEKMAQVGRLAEHCCCILGSAAAAPSLLITFCCLILHRPPLQAWIPATATTHLLILPQHRV